MNTATEHAFLPAWDDPVHDAQTTFRCILKALSEPGLIQTLPTATNGPDPLGAACTALCLTLADLETPVWLDVEIHTPAVESFLRFHCGCPLASDPAQASFGILNLPTSELTLERFAQGSLEFPDRSTTLLIQVTSLDGGPLRVLAGPGIPGTRSMHVDGLPSDFNRIWTANAACFPLGVDLIFCCGNTIVGLPRTTQIRHSETQAQG
ncbi:phosphonate C-P lyase system protein PhnH [soil metagenome]